jgi:hypothetical protein
MVLTVIYRNVRTMPNITTFQRAVAVTSRGIHWFYVVKWQMVNSPRDPVMDFFEICSFKLTLFSQ